MIERDDIATCAQAPIAGTVEDDQRHIRIILPPDQRLVDRRDHLIAQRIDRPWPIKRDASGPAFASDEDIGIIVFSVGHS
jgi:hypothetical protein